MRVRMHWTEIDCELAENNYPKRGDLVHPKTISCPRTARLSRWFAALPNERISRISDRLLNHFVAREWLTPRHWHRMTKSECRTTRHDYIYFRFGLFGRADKHTRRDTDDGSTTQMICTPAQSTRGGYSFWNIFDAQTKMWWIDGCEREIVGRHANSPAVFSRANLQLDGLSLYQSLAGRFKRNLKQKTGNEEKFNKTFSQN